MINAVTAEQTSNLSWASCVCTFSPKSEHTVKPYRTNRVCEKEFSPRKEFLPRQKSALHPNNNNDR